MLLDAKVENENQGDCSGGIAGYDEHGESAYQTKKTARSASVRSQAVEASEASVTYLRWRAPVLAKASPVRMRKAPRMPKAGSILVSSVYASSPVPVDMAAAVWSMLG